MTELVLKPNQKDFKDAQDNSAKNLGEGPFFSSFFLAADFGICNLGVAMEISHMCEFLWQKCQSVNGEYSRWYQAHVH